MKTFLKIVAFAAFVAVLASLWWTYFGRYHVWQISFDAAAWKQAEPQKQTKQDGYRTARSKMVDDLLRTYQFNGWTRQQIVELLGQPTSEWSGFEQWDLFYVLGLERGGAFSLDDEALGFRFDTSGRVADYGLSVN